MTHNELKVRISDVLSPIVREVLSDIEKLDLALVLQYQYGFITEGEFLSSAIVVLEKKEPNNSFFPDINF
jgi:hypothetical protein